MSIRLCAFADEASKDFAGQIAALKRNNIRLIELRNIDGKNIGAVTQKEAEAYCAALAKNGIGVWSLGSPLGKIKITDCFEEHTALTKHLVGLARIFHCGKIRVFSFFTKDYGKYRDEVLKRLKVMCSPAREAGITLYHENEKDIYGDKAERVADILENVEGIGSVFDPANYVQVGQDIDAAIRLLADKSGYFHIKDALYETGEVVPAGYGDAKVQKLIESIGGRDIVLSLEPHLKVFGGYSVIDSHELKNAMTFGNNGEAFDFAAKALKELLVKCGYRENKTGDYIK
jgi:sugar phosphate isomerase/epimerase